MTFREIQISTEGYVNGLFWPDAWETHGNPGGPWVYRGNDKKLAQASLNENIIWRQYWAKGHQDKLANGYKVSIDEHRKVCDSIP